jgi:hypothetical protein
VSRCQRQLDSPGQWAVCLCQCVLPCRLAPLANQALGFDNEVAETGVDTTKRIFEDAGNTNVYDHVLKFLLKDTAHEGWDWNADSLASLKQLETHGVLQDLHIEGQHVTTKAMYQRYQFTNLQKLSTLYDDIASTVETEESYKEEDSRNICQCSDHSCRKCRPSPSAETASDWPGPSTVSLHAWYARVCGSCHAQWRA